jgi:acyl phosphate:glycerol-3-phosphate acyltransferase
MNFWIAFGILCSSYLLGSLSFARIVTRIWTGKDVTQFELPVEDDQETYKAIAIGANTVSTQLGAKGGMVVSILDISKVALAAFLSRYLFPQSNWAPILASIGGMLGHIWPVYHNFHGGAGFSAIVGGLIILDPLAVLVSPLIGLLLGMVIFRNMIVATLSWIWLLIPWFLLRKPAQPEFIIYSIAVNFLFILAMIPEIKMGLKYKKEGKMDQYGIGSMSANPMGRGYLKMARAIGFMKKEVSEEGSEKD